MIPWPALTPDDRPTLATLHLASQMAGNLAVALLPWENHGWHVALTVTPRGLESRTLLAPGGGFRLRLDLIDRAIVVETAEGERTVPLAPTTAATHRTLVAALDALGRFRTGFLGKASPVQFWWGSFDLATQRFSGRDAPRHPGGVPNLPDPITREAYSRELSSAGFFPGGADGGDPAFYSYAYPAPDGFATAAELPDGARWDDGLGEYVLPWAAINASQEPDALVQAFFTATYEAAARLGGWDRERLEGAIGRKGAVRPGF